MFFVALLALLTIAVAAFLRHTRMKWWAAIPAAALLFPAVYAFAAFIYPADPEMRMWALIAVPVSFAWGLVASALGYGLMALVQRVRTRPAA